MKLTGFAVALVILTACTSSEEKKIFNSYTVEIKGMQFQPATLSVEKGDTVIFMNNDMLMHNVTETETKSWASPDLSTGQRYTHIVSKSADYYCTIHPTMKGKLVVK